MQKSLKIFYFFLILFSSLSNSLNSDSKAILSEQKLSSDSNEAITISISEIKNDVYYGTNKNFYLNTEYKDYNNYFDASDIENTEFSITLYYSYNTRYYANCRLWKPVNDYLKVLCQITSYNIYGRSVYIRSSSFYYKSHRITTPQTGYFTITYINQFPFLYADEQNIVIEEDKKFYELKFKMRDYNNQLLYLNSTDTYISLDKCTGEGNYLICTLEKDDIIEVLKYKNQIFNVYSYNSNSNFNKYRIDLIYNITINDNRISEKKEIYIGITKLLEQYIDQNNYIPYETNVTDISDLVSGLFNVERKDYNDSIICYLKKAGIKPLLSI